MVYNRGRSYVSDLFVMYVYRTGEPEKLCGFSVSRKTGKACVRNRIKRMASEVLRRFLPGTVTGTRLVFVARKSAGEADFQHINKSISVLLKKAGLFSE